MIPASAQVPAEVGDYTVANPALEVEAGVSHTSDHAEWGRSTTHKDDPSVEHTMHEEEELDIPLPDVPSPETYLGFPDTFSCVPLDCEGSPHPSIPPSPSAISLASTAPQSSCPSSPPGSPMLVSSGPASPKHLASSPSSCFESLAIPDDLSMLDDVMSFTESPAPDKPPSPKASSLPKLATIFTLAGMKAATSTLKRKSEEAAAAKSGKRHKVASEGGQAGQSRSAVASREAREKAAKGEFVWSPKKLTNWQFKIWELDEDAVLGEDNLHVRCSCCGKWLKIKEAYDATRYKDHYKDCKKKHKGGLPTLKQMAGWFGWTFRRPKTAHQSQYIVQEESEPTTDLQHPCRGVDARDDERIGTYLRRTGAVGGGGRSPVVIAKERLKKTFGDLTRQQKMTILDVQISEHKWRNDFRRTRVYATNCFNYVKTPEKSCERCCALLQLGRFRRAIRKPIPKDENYIFVNHLYRDPHLGELYAKTLGLRGLLDPDAKGHKSPFVRYTLGVLENRYTGGELLAGLLESVMIQEDKQRRGVGMQNFRWPVEYDRFMHLLAIESPKTFRLVKQYLPARTERSYR
ncbi:hypothetical protein GSI_14847 [Ganoderma sinense ZZ0214-1]|nr:hypothetical protein GSI_14847 [Ganoderma sinense ZZ0214-1]